MPLIKIMIVDDHPLARQGLRKILSLDDDFVVVGEAENGNEGLRKVSALYPDVVLMDINLPGKNGIELTEEIKKKYPAINILALTVETDQYHVHKIIKAGALGYVLKDIEPDALIEAIKVIARGEAYIQPCLLSKLLIEFRQFMDWDRPGLSPQEMGLTPREVEIITYIAEGESNKGIAQKLGLSEKTVKNHVSNILRKMSLSDRTQVAVYAYRKGLISR